MVGVYIVRFDSQILSNDWGYVAVPSLDGSVVVNIGDVMQLWTSDEFLSRVSGILLYMMIR